MAKTQTVTILFCDLVSSTERRSRLGDDAADEFVDRFKVALREAVARHDGREFKDVGDGIQAVFPDSAADAVSCAIDMHRSVAALDPDDPPQLRIGISAGEVAQSGTDWSGTPVVEAARLEAAAQPGQTLASHVVRALVGTRRALRFRDVGALTLKGLPDPLPTVEVVDEEIADVPPVAADAATRPGPTRRGLLIAALAFVMVAAIAGIVVALTHSNRTSHATANDIIHPTGYTPRFVTHDCPAAVRDKVKDATCGSLEVPQDRKHPEGKWIKLSVTQAPARVKTSAAPTIDIGSHELAATSPVRDHAELIQIDDRGFPTTEPSLACPEASSALRDGYAHAVDDPAATTALTTAIGKCRARLVHDGVEPGAYNLQAETQDILDLMAALRIRSVDLVSGTAQTMAAFGVLDQVPGAVRSITLENPFPPGDGYLTNPVGHLAAAFTTYSDLCDQSAPCKRAYPDLRRVFDAVRDGYAAAPRTVSATCACDTSLPPIPVRLDGPRATDALAAALSNTDTFGAIPGALSPKPLDPVIASYARQHMLSDLEGDQLGGTLSYFCSNFVHTVDHPGSEIARRAYPEFVGTDATAPWLRWCAAWDVPNISERLASEVASQVPVLMVRGQISPIGDPRWVDELARSLPNATVARFPTLGNDLLTSGPACLNQIRRDFLANPQANLRRSVDGCTSSSPAINFAVP